MVLACAGARGDGTSPVPGATRLSLSDAIVQLHDFGYKVNGEWNSQDNPEVTVPGHLKGGFEDIAAWATRFNCHLSRYGGDRFSMVPLKLRDEHSGNPLNAQLKDFHAEKIGLEDLVYKLADAAHASVILLDVNSGLADKVVFPKVDIKACQLRDAYNQVVSLGYISYWNADINFDVGPEHKAVANLQFVTSLSCL